MRVFLDKYSATAERASMRVADCAVAFPSTPQWERLRLAALQMILQAFLDGFAASEGSPLGPLCSNGCFATVKRGLCRNCVAASSDVDSAAFRLAAEGD